MNQHYKMDRYLLFTLPFCVVAAVILTSLVSFSVKSDLLHQLKKIEFIVDSNTDFNAELYYTYGTVFTNKQKIKNSGSSKDTLVFEIPKGSAILKKFRLDFGTNLLLKNVKIKAMNLVFKQKTTHLNEKEVFKYLFVNSASITLNKSQGTIEIRSDFTPFDPYVVFSPLAEVARPQFTYMAALLFPFIIMLFIYFLKHLKSEKINLLLLFTLLFILCIPLKIAWTTFLTLLLCAYGIVRTFQNGKIYIINTAFYIYSTFFCVLVLIGRPNTISIIDKYWALLLFGIVSLSIVFPSRKVFLQYVYFMTIFNAVMVAAGISFLLWFQEFYALDIVDYFRDIKIYSGRIRDWLFYDHAVFLTFFSLIGLLLAHELYKRQTLEKPFLILYHGLLLLFIVLVGARICLLIYFIYLMNFLIKWRGKQRILANAFLFIMVAISLGCTIQKIDEYRYYLWSVSWEAIKEKPWFGYGLGTSNKILHDNLFIVEAGFNSDLDFNHSHNQFITFFLELGVFGSFGLLLILTFWLYRTEQYKNKQMALFLVGLGYIFLTESIFETSKPLYIICFLFLLLANKDEKLAIKN